MKELFEEYGGIVAIAIIGSTVIGGFIEIMMYMKSLGLF